MNLKKNYTSILAILLSISFYQPLLSQENKPKNIILLIGDGMGISAVSTSILNDSSSAFKKFRFVGLSITCSADKLITDSAAGATALSTGERTNNHYIGVAADSTVLENVFERAKKQKYATGIVSTSSITHATPAGFYAHVTDRSKEFLIAEQFQKSEIDVAIGGGRNFFLPENKNGQRKDNLDLIQALDSKDYSYFTKIEDLSNYSGSDKILGLLEDASIKNAGERNYSLGDLTKIAINNLSKNDNGFVLMVEGSQIDWGAHDNNAKKVLAEMDDFSKAINAALEFAKNNGNTLVVVTADHETGGTSIIGGNFNKVTELGFVSKGHTGTLVGIFSYGPGAEMFQGVLENRQIGKNLFQLLNSN